MENDSERSYVDLLKDGGFQAFLWTQFLGAYNDNVYKLVVSFLAVDLAPPETSGKFLSLAGVVFMVPYFFFSGYSGHLADSISKRSVMIGVKVFEIAAMVLGMFALLSGRIDFLLGVLCLMAVHSTVFSPAKYGIVPEMLDERDISRANGLLEMSTFVAIVLGTTTASLIYAYWKGAPWRISMFLIGIAVLGTLTSLRITKTHAVPKKGKFFWNPWTEVIIGTQKLLQDQPMWLAVVGNSYFWFLGALVQLTLLLFGKEDMHLASESETGILAVFLAIGIGAGSMAAGRLSGDKIEIGLVPLGSAGVVISCYLVSISASSYALTAFLLTTLGFFAGLFAVPLNALIQHRSDEDEKGRILATNNFYNTIGILAASGVLYLVHDVLHQSASRVMAVAATLTMLSTFYALWIAPEYFVRFCVWMLTHSIYKIRIIGRENMPLHGPALIVANHVSFVDPFLIASCMQRFIRFLMYRPYYENPWLNPFFKLAKAIPLSQGGKRDIIESLRKAKQELKDGHVVCIFPEGGLTRTGNMQSFKKGVERVVDGLDVPIIPVHLDGVWGSIFSFERGRFFSKLPRRVPHPVTITFGKPLPSSASVFDMRQAVMELSAEAVEYRRQDSDLLPLRFIATAKRQWNSLALAESGGREIKYGEALIGASLLAKRLRKHAHGQATIGVLLPASAAATLANVAIALAGKASVNLNFTAGAEAMAHALKDCEMQTIFTAKAFLAKAKIEQRPEMVFVEDWLQEFTPMQKALEAAKFMLLPAGVLQQMHRDASQSPYSLATVIFSSGSTGMPKGVMLSHSNVLSNIESMHQVYWIGKGDCIVGVLPPFHSFGLTATIWFPLVVGASVVYHPNPLDAAVIGDVTQKYGGTLLITTPTFAALYARKCDPAQFSSLRYFIVGAERLRESIAKTFREKYNIEILEGYGCTEMSPTVAANTPEVVDGEERQGGPRPGSVGHPLPNVVVKTVDPDTFEDRHGAEGLLLAKGPNRMMGYLNQPDRTADVSRSGWYVTGDIASIDQEGYIRIIDRLARFSKIGGEMVPHGRVEEAVANLLKDGACAVTAIPDEQKGEALAVLYTDGSLTPSQLLEGLQATDMPKLWIPKKENIRKVESLPLLGNGKLDLRKAKSMAVELMTKQ